MRFKKSKLKPLELLEPLKPWMLPNAQIIIPLPEAKMESDQSDPRAVDHQKKLTGRFGKWPGTYR